MRHKLSVENRSRFDGFTPKCKCGWQGEEMATRAAAVEKYASHLEDLLRSTGTAIRISDVTPFPHPEFAQESERPVPAALQAAVNEVEALRLMSYTGGAADLCEEDVREIRSLLIDLTLLLAEQTGEPLPEAEMIL